MIETSRPGNASGHRLLPRRSMLILGAGLGLGLAGCTDDQPAPPSPSQTPTPAPAPKPIPGMVDGAALESSLAEFAFWTADVFDDELSTADHRLLLALQQAHQLHAAVLSADAPLALPGPGLPDSSSSPVPSASPSPDPSGSASASMPPSIEVGDDVDAAFATLAAMEADIADGHQRLALQPGLDEDQHLEQDQLQQLILLWGSLSAADYSYAIACERRNDPGKAVHGAQRISAVWPSPAKALQNTLAQTYAMIFGYQTAIAKLNGAEDERARSRLSDLRDLRDLLSGRLADDDHEVPSPHPAYRLPVQPTSGTKAVRLMGSLEDGFLPHLGQWLGTETDDRSDAVQTMIDTARQATVWSSSIDVWPGWPS